MQIEKYKKDTHLVIWFSRVLRWGFGGIFLWAGLHFNGGWLVIVFGAVFVISGFFRPKRCLEESCEVTSPVCI
jgi:hypothetical protein